MKSIVKSDPDSIGTAVAGIVAGKPVSIPLAEKPAELNDINTLGYALLDNALREMTPYEIQFSASMVGQQNALSGRQRAVLKKVAIKYLGIDIDGASEPLSAPIANDGETALGRSSARMATAELDRRAAIAAPVAANENPATKRRRRAA